MDNMPLPWIRSEIERGEKATCNVCKKSIDSTNGCKLSPVDRVLKILSAEDPKQIYICADCYKEKLSGLKTFLLGIVNGMDSI